MLNRPSPRLAILRAELARESVALRCERIMYASSAHHPRVNRAPPPVAADMPLPPSYDEDLAEWLECLKGKSNSEIAAFEDWLLRVRPSGCVEQVENAWLESSDYDEWFSAHLGASGPKRCAKAASNTPQPAVSAWRSVAGCAAS